TGRSTDSLLELRYARLRDVSWPGPYDEPWEPNGSDPINLSLPTIRLAHLSDIHVTVSGCAWRREDWLNKRLAAWANLRLLGRGFRFRRAETVLATLAADLRAAGPHGRSGADPPLGGRAAAGDWPRSSDGVLPGRPSLPGV